MTAAEVAPVATAGAVVLAEIDRLTAEVARLQIRLGEERERNEDLTCLLEMARDEVGAEQRRNAELRLRLPRQERPSLPITVRSRGDYL